MRRLTAALVALAAFALLAPVVGEAQDGMVKIGVLDDMSGPYADNTGPGDLLASWPAPRFFKSHLLRSGLPRRKAR